MTAPLASVRWLPSYRLVASHFPPRNLFDRVASAEDLDVVQAIEGLTNDRLRDEIGELHLVPPEDRIYGEGTGPIMAAFTHLNPSGSRFSDGTYGVYYAAKTIDTAIAETCFHRARFLHATAEAPIEFDMRSYAADIVADLNDFRHPAPVPDGIYDPDPNHYGPAQDCAKALRTAGSDGIIYDSVRDEGGQCVAVFRPKVVGRAQQGAHYCYVWDGERIADIYVKTAYVRGKGPAPVS